MNLIFFLVLFACLAIVAVRNFPSRDSGARRRLVWLGLLALPIAVAIGFGPFVINHHALSPDGRQWMIVLQQTALAAYAVVFAALLIFIRGGRMFTATIGAAGSLVSIAIAAVHITIIDPGS